MLMKLALSGMMSKSRDYAVLLAGLVISISIFYMFQTMAWNREFTENNAVINSIRLVYVVGSFLLAAITFFYILYANGFLLSLRRREFGLYMMLGARKNKIRRLMFAETIAVGLLSLAGGLALGFALSALVGGMMARQLQTDLTGYYPVYGPAILFTVLFFAVLFGISAAWNQLKLARLQVLQLLNGGMQADRAWQKSAGKLALGIAGLIALLLGYLALTFMERLRETGLFTAAIMTPLGTYLLFMTVLPPAVAGLKLRNGLRGIRAFTYGQLSFRINGLAKLLATVAMLIALGAGAIAGGLAFVNDAMIRAESYRVYDAAVHNPTAEEEKVLDGIPFEERFAYRYILQNEVLYFVKEDFEKQRPFVRREDSRKNWDKLRRIDDPVPAGSPDSGDTPSGEADGAYSSEWSAFLSEIAPPEQGFRSYRIVDESAFEAVRAERQIVVIGRTGDFPAYRPAWAELDKLNEEKHGGMSVSWSKYENYERQLGIASGTVFMGFFLGIAFLAMMASCLMFKILSGAARDIRRYEMLHKLGVRKEMLSRSIARELLLVFLFPGAAGLAHVVVGMNLFSFILAEPYYKLWAPIAIFIAIYAVYYFITFRLYRNIVMAGKN